MRTGVSFSVSSGDRQRLEAIVADGNRPQKHVWRARIIFLSDDGLGTAVIITASGKSKTCVWRWQERFMEEGVDGLLRGKTRPSGTPPTPPGKVAEIVRQTQPMTKGATTRWRDRLATKVAVFQFPCWTLNRAVPLQDADRVLRTQGGASEGVAEEMVPQPPAHARLAMKKTPGGRNGDGDLLCEQSRCEA